MLRATPNHPIAARGRWVPAGELRVGERVATVDGEIEITSVGESVGPVTVYDLTVEPTHAYVAGGVAVHNY